MITVTILFKNDPSVGLFSESFKMEIPDFREDWTESEEELGKFTEEQRIAIMELYKNLDNNSCPQVIFQWELEEIEQALSPIEEDTYNEIVKESEDELFEDIKNIINWEDKNHRVLRDLRGIKEIEKVARILAKEFSK